jgi:hypothetical protein
VQSAEPIARVQHLTHLYDRIRSRGLVANERDVQLAQSLVDQLIGTLVDFEDAKGMGRQTGHDHANDSAGH